MTSPHDIRTRTFRLATRGYDRVEVTEFLGVVAEEMEDLLDELDRLAARVGIAPPPPALAGAVTVDEDDDDVVIDLRDPFSVFAPRTAAPTRRPVGAMASLLPPPDEPSPVTDEPVPPVEAPAPRVDEPVDAAAEADDVPGGAPIPADVLSTLPPPPAIDLTVGNRLPSPEQLGRQVAEMLRQAEIDATDIRSRALAELEEARRQSARLRAEVEMQSREHVEGVLAEFRTTISRLARVERDARDRLRAINEHLTIVLAGAVSDPGVDDQEVTMSIPIGDGSTSTPDDASKA